MAPDPENAVILDFDGVIADSMPQHLEAYRRVLEPFGVKVTKMDVYSREGARSESIIRTLLQQNHVEKDDAQIKALGDEKQRIYRSLGDVALYPEADRFVRELRGMTPRLGLVTGTRKVNVEQWAPGLVPFFDTILAQESYTKDKPDPEPYAKAIEALGVPAERCVVIENAQRGVKSAKAADAGRVIAITTTMPRADLIEAGADLVVDDHASAVKGAREWLAGL